MPFNPKILDELARKLTSALPPGVSQLSEDVQTNLRAGLESSLTKLNLVSREEFEVQSQLLIRTRSKLEQLEQQIAELEKQLSEKKK